MVRDRIPDGAGSEPDVPDEWFLAQLRDSGAPGSSAVRSRPVARGGKQTRRRMAKARVASPHTTPVLGRSSTEANSPSDDFEEPVADPIDVSNSDPSGTADAVETGDSDAYEVRDPHQTEADDEATAAVEDADAREIVEPTGSPRPRGREARTISEPIAARSTIVARSSPNSTVDSPPVEDLVARWALEIAGLDDDPSPESADAGSRLPRLQKSAPVAASSAVSAAKPREARPPRRRPGRRRPATAGVAATAAVETPLDSSTIETDPPVVDANSPVVESGSPVVEPLEAPTDASPATPDIDSSSADGAAAVSLESTVDGPSGVPVEQTAGADEPEDVPEEEGVSEFDVITTSDEADTVDEASPSQPAATADGSLVAGTLAPVAAGTAEPVVGDVAEPAVADAHTDTRTELDGLPTDSSDAVDTDTRFDGIEAFAGADPKTDGDGEGTTHRRFSRAVVPQLLTAAILLVLAVVGTVAGVTAPSRSDATAGSTPVTPETSQQDGTEQTPTPAPTQTPELTIPLTPTEGDVPALVPPTTRIPSGTSTPQGTQSNQGTQANQGPRQPGTSPGSSGQGGAGQTGAGQAGNPGNGSSGSGTTEPGAGGTGTGTGTGDLETDGGGTETDPVGGEIPPGTPGDGDEEPVVDDGVPDPNG